MDARELRLGSVLYWDHRGVLLHGGRRIAEDPWGRASRRAKPIEWSGIVEVESACLFPDVRIAAREGTAVAWARARLFHALHEPTVLVENASALAWEAHALAFLGFTRQRVYATVRDVGWASMSRMAWRRAEFLPSRPRRLGTAFRTGEPTREVLLRDVEREPGPRGAWPCRLGARVVHPDAIEVTSELVYANDPDGQVLFMPRDGLRAIVTEYDRYGRAYLVHFVFGRDAHLVVGVERAARIERVLLEGLGAVQRDEFHPRDVLTCE